MYDYNVYSSADDRSNRSSCYSSDAMMLCYGTIRPAFLYPPALLRVPWRGKNCGARMMCGERDTTWSNKSFRKRHGGDSARAGLGGVTTIHLEQHRYTRFSLSMEMSRLTRDGTAEPVSRDQILRHARGQGNVHFSCSADHEQDWQPFPVDPYSAVCDVMTIHT